MIAAIVECHHERETMKRLSDYALIERREPGDQLVVLIFEKVPVEERPPDLRPDGAPVQPASPSIEDDEEEVMA